MVCVNKQYRAAIQWDDIAIYGFVVEPTEYELCLVDAINSLPVTCRQMVIMFACDTLWRETIAKILGMPLKEVQDIIRCNGLEIRRYLAEHGHPSVINKKLDKCFKGWPYSEYGDIVMLRKRGKQKTKVRIKSV